MIDATVIIAAWNARAHLARSVDSALAQQGVTLEVIVVDDASTDGTADLADQMAARDARVSVLRLPENGGPAAARNAGIDKARGAWIAVLDSDDAMEADRLASMIALAQTHGADAVYDNLQPVDAGGTPAGPVHIAGIDAPVCWDIADFLAGNQARPDRASLGFLKPLISRKFIDDNALRYDPGLRNGEDFHLMLEMLVRKAQLWFMPRAGYLYTTRSGSISNRLDPAHARALARADSAFVKRHADALTPDCVALIRQRQTRIADLAAAEAALQALRARHPMRATAALIQRPRALGRFATQLKEALRRRLA